MKSRSSEIQQYKPGAFQGKSVGYDNCSYWISGGPYLGANAHCLPSSFEKSREIYFGVYDDIFPHGSQKGHVYRGLIDGENRLIDLGFLSRYVHVDAFRRIVPNSSVGKQARIPYFFTKPFAGSFYQYARKLERIKMLGGESSLNDEIQKFEYKAIATHDTSYLSYDYKNAGIKALEPRSFIADPLKRDASEDYDLAFFETFSKDFFFSNSLNSEASSFEKVQLLPYHIWGQLSSEINTPNVGERVYMLGNNNTSTNDTLPSTYTSYNASVIPMVYKRKFNFDIWPIYAKSGSSGSAVLSQSNHKVIGVQYGGYTLAQNSLPFRFKCTTLFEEDKEYTSAGIGLRFPELSNRRPPSLENNQNSLNVLSGSSFLGEGQKSFIWRAPSGFGAAGIVGTTLDVGGDKRVGNLGLVFLPFPKDKDKEKEKVDDLMYRYYTLGFSQAVVIAPGSIDVSVVSNKFDDYLPWRERKLRMLSARNEELDYYLNTYLTTNKNVSGFSEVEGVKQNTGHTLFQQQLTMCPPGYFLAELWALTEKNNRYGLDSGFIRTVLSIGCRNFYDRQKFTMRSPRNTIGADSAKGSFLEIIKAPQGTLIEELRTNFGLFRNVFEFGCRSIK